MYWTCQTQFLKKEDPDVPVSLLEHACLAVCISLQQMQTVIRY